jgi:hypothetical protein
MLLNQKYFSFLKSDMDISDATLIALSGLVVAGSSVVIFLVNYKTIFKCCAKKQEQKVDSVNPLNTVQTWN